MILFFVVLLTVSPKSLEMPLYKGYDDGETLSRGLPKGLPKGLPTLSVDRVR